MDTGIFVALINPGIAISFAGAFLLLWNYQRHKRYILLTALSLVAGAIGFLIQYLSIETFALSRLSSNLLFVFAGVGMAVSLLARYKRALSLTTVLALVGGGVGLFVWFLYVTPHTAARVYTINFTFGLLTLMVAAQLRAVPSRRAIDNVMLVLTAFWGLSYFLRPLVVLWIEGVPIEDSSYHQSLYWYTLTLFSAMFILLISLAWIGVLVLDIMDDLGRQSRTDLLSGLLNRRGFEESVTQILAQAESSALPMSMIVCDLDHFKKVNDTYGHVIGDAVIRSFADRLKQHVGERFVTARIGGEEFAILLCGANESAARLFAEGIRASYKSAACMDLPAAVGKELRTTASFGVAQWLSGESGEQLFLRADNALYEAKDAGRDCVRIAEMPRDQDSKAVS